MTDYEERITAPSILRGDARHLPLADNTVDLIVTSPPYYGLRSYTDGGQHYDAQLGSETTPAEFVDALITVTKEYLRVLKPSGSMWINLGDKYVADNRGSGADVKRGAAKWAPVGKRGFAGEGIMSKKSLMGIPWRYALRCIDELGLILRAEVIWSKPNGLPESAVDRVRRSHEQWFHLTANTRYFSAMEDIREPASGYQRTRAMADTCNPLGRLPGSVWEIPTQPLKVPESLGVAHHAAFPMEWPRRIIRGWSPQDGVVLDPFSGTGTTALVAAMNGRTGIGVDASSDYCHLAQWRCSDPKERARAMGIDPDRVARIQYPTAGQGDLFGAVS